MKKLMLASIFAAIVFLAAAHISFAAPAPKVEQEEPCDTFFNGMSGDIHSWGKPDSLFNRTADWLAIFDKTSQDKRRILAERKAQRDAARPKK